MLRVTEISLRFPSVFRTRSLATLATNTLRVGFSANLPGASIPMGQGGHVPPIFGPGGHDHECPPNISGVISATFYPCNIFLIS